MAGEGRVIRKEMPEEEQNTSQALKELRYGTVLVKAEEMRNFVKEWITAGSGDLVIDESLCNRLNKYADFQKEFGGAMANLLEQELERYVIETDDDYIQSCGLVNFVLDNNKALLKAEAFADYVVEDETDDWDVKLIRLRDFKRLLASLGNKVVSYAFTVEDELYFDFFLYCKEMGIDFKTKTSKSGEIKTIQLILPDDWGNKDA